MVPLVGNVYYSRIKELDCSISIDYMLKIPSIMDIDVNFY